MSVSIDQAQLGELGWRLVPIAATGNKHAGSVLGAGWQAMSSSDHRTISGWQDSGHNHAAAL